MTASGPGIERLLVALLATACVDLEVDPIGRPLPCALPTPSAAPEDAVVVLRGAVDMRWLTICSGVAISPRLVATQLKCVLGRAQPAKTEAMEDPPPPLPLEFAIARSGSSDLPSRCQAEAGWRPIENGDFANRLGEPLDPSLISATKTWVAPNLPGIAATKVFAMTAQSLCGDDLALVALEDDLDVPPVAVRFGEPPAEGRALRLSGFCNNTETSVIERQESSVAVEAVAEVTASIQAPARSLLVSNTVAAYSAGGAAIAEDSNAVVGIITSGTLMPDCSSDAADGSTLVTTLAPYRRMLLDAAEDRGQTLYAEFQPEIGVQLCPEP